MLKRSPAIGVELPPRTSIHLRLAFAPIPKAVLIVFVAPDTPATVPQTVYVSDVPFAIVRGAVYIVNEAFPFKSMRVLVPLTPDEGPARRVFPVESINWSAVTLKAPVDEVAIVTGISASLISPAASAETVKVPSCTVPLWSPEVVEPVKATVGLVPTSLWLEGVTAFVRVATLAMVEPLL